MHVLRAFILIKYVLVGLQESKNRLKEVESNGNANQ